MRPLFSEGGPYKIRRIGHEQYDMSIPLPRDSEGRAARECPSAICSPGYFKVKPGTGITESHTVAFCPYCRSSAEPGKFFTKSQLQYAKEIVKREAAAGVGDMLRDALKIPSSGKRSMRGALFNIELSVKSNPSPPVYRPFEEALQRTVICPKCGLDHGVFGLAVWCPDCGADIFLTHVTSELNVIKTMLTDVPRRQTDFGHRIAARDLENCLEDTVSVYEAVLKAMLVRALRTRGTEVTEIENILKRCIGNKLQSISLSQETIQQLLAINLFAAFENDEIHRIQRTFEKRHPITHNLGVVDRKYLERVRIAERKGREILVTADEIEQAINTVFRIVSELNRRLFDSTTEEVK